MSKRNGEPVARLGALIRTHRREQGLTQRELAHNAGLSVAAIRDLEQGRRSRPRNDSLVALCRALDLHGDRAAEVMSAAAAPGRAEGKRPDDGQPRSDEGLWVSILGPLSVWLNGTQLPIGPPTRQAILGLLSLSPGSQVRRETLIDVLWGERPPDTAVNLVQAHVSRLRRLLAPGEVSVASAGAGYRMHLSDKELDLLAFRELAARAADASASGALLTAYNLYRQAVELWHGDPLADVELLRGQPGVIDLGRERSDVLLSYADVASHLGWHDRVLPQLRDLVRADPLNERAHAQLMISLAGSGQQAAAVQVYEDVRRRLSFELGVYPSEELVNAHLRVLRQDVPATTCTRTPSAKRRLHPARSVKPRQLPAPVRHFTGHDAALAGLSALLDRMPQPEPPQHEPPQQDNAGRAQRPDTADRAVVIAALTGMAGIGKSALAIHWAHQVAEQFTDGQLFVNLHGYGPTQHQLTPAAAIRGFLTALGLPPSEVPADMAQLTALYRSLLAGRRMLVVLDNARDASHIRPLLPGSAGCMVLVTSRNQLIGLAAANGAQLFPIGPLGDAHSLDLLARGLGTQRVSAEPEAARELAGLCGGLPLALNNAAARAAARPTLPLATIVDTLRDEEIRLDGLDTGEPTTSSRTVFSWSLATLTSRAALLFRLLGVHPGPDITVEVAASLAGLSRRQARLALSELCDGHLITEYAPARYVCHDLLRIYAAEQARLVHSAAELKSAVLRVLDHYQHTAAATARLLLPYLSADEQAEPLPGVLPQEIPDPQRAAQWLADERLALLAAIDRAVSGGFACYAWELPWVAGLLFDAPVEWHKLAASLELALTIAGKLGSDTGRALAHHQLGRLRFRLGQYADSVRHLTDAIDLVQHRNTRLHALARLDIARAFDAQGLGAAALAQTSRSLQLFRSTNDRNGQGLALRMMGRHYARQGEYRLALGFCSHALAPQAEPAVGRA